MRHMSVRLTFCQRHAYMTPPSLFSPGGVIMWASACRKGAVLAVVIASLTVPALAAPPFPRPKRPPWPPGATDPTVTFRTGALFTCLGGTGGTATTNSADVSATFTTITAKVTVHAPAGTQVFGQLTQGGCLRLKFFT